MVAADRPAPSLHVVSYVEALSLFHAPPYAVVTATVWVHDGDLWLSVPDPTDQGLVEHVLRPWRRAADPTPNPSEAP